MHPDHGPAPIDASLHLLADHLVDELGVGGVPPALIHVTAGDAEGFELGIRPLEGVHPTELLVGFRAPEHWHALGVATGGWAYHVSERASASRTRTRVHVVSVLSRTGEFAHRTRVEGDPLLDALLDDPAEQPGGEQVDLLRRALSLPTDPPPCGAEVYWTIEWLSELLGTPTDRLAGWSDVVGRHPSMRLARSHPDEIGRLAQEHDVAEIAAAFARVFDWSRLRSMLGEGRFDVPELVPDDGPWFDDGSFARFLLNRCPPLSMLRRQVVEHLGADLGERMVTVLDRLGIPASAWPDETDQAA